MFIFSLVFRRLSLVRLAGLLHYSTLVDTKREGLVLNRLCELQH